MSYSNVSGLGRSKSRHIDVRRWPVVFIVLAMVIALTAPAVGAISTTAKEPSEHAGVLLDAGWENASVVIAGNYDPSKFKGSMYTVAQVLTGAADFWDAGYTGAGVDVALIDSGIVPVNGLTYPGKVIDAADLSFESQAENLQYLDTYGHGTHLAGIIVGRDDGAKIARQSGNPNEPFLGMAPGARIVNVKVADHDGAVDVSQVIAAIDWVVQHRNDNGMNIRVLALAYGTDSSQIYTSDPLAFAVEQAWKAGIVVVAAAGNDGNAFPLRDPANDPYVIAVGALDSETSIGIGDDIVTSFSNCGTDSRGVDLVAPGRSIVSLRNPGSEADLNYPEAVVDERYFLGSGTSQATAVVAGAAALIVDQRPDITPGEVKALLMQTALPMASATDLCQGAGELDLSAAVGAPTPEAASRLKASRGTGLLEAARGSDHLEANGVVLKGEQDIFGVSWDGRNWAKASAAGSSWSGGTWNGSSWSGSSWSGSSWSGNSWSGSSWSGSSWSGSSWSGSSWSGNSWSGSSWSGSSWSGSSWSGSSWSGNSWSCSNGKAEAGLSWE